MPLGDPRRMLGIVVLMFCTIASTHVRQNVAEVASDGLREIRRRWGAAEIVRDLDHIKEDVQKITKMQDTGEITTHEALFYFLRMHDFDDNSKLDGHELLAAMTHAIDHGPDGALAFDEKETIVDSFFAYDDNMDGFISYPELRKHLAPDDSGGQ